MTRLAGLAVLAAATVAAAQGRVPQRPARGDCTRGEFTAGAVRLCNLSDALSSVPQVFVGGRLEQLDFRATPDETSGLGWVGATSLKGSPLVVGVLDWQVESGGKALVLVSSADFGKSWRRLPDLAKPHYTANFRSLELESARRWVLKITLEDCAGCGVAPGTRVFETHDAGRHWAESHPVRR